MLKFKKIKWYIRRLLYRLEFIGKDILSYEQTQDKIMLLLNKDNSIMISRLGGFEMRTLYEDKYLNSFSQLNSNAMQKNTGFFPINKKSLVLFSNLYLKHASIMDIVGASFNLGEGRIIKKYLNKALVTKRAFVEPFYTNKNWTKSLKNKKVLVIHPFEETILKQFKHKEKIFDNGLICLDFELLTIKAVQSIGGESEFASWFEAFDYMCEEIDKLDFDIAIIGAGAYGLPLAGYVKSIGRKSIHLGGSTQLLFGIKGNRWDEDPIISKLYNKYWVRPSDKEVPKSSKDVENGCYW